MKQQHWKNLILLSFLICNILLLLKINPLKIIHAPYSRIATHTPKSIENYPAGEVTSKMNITQEIKFVPLGLNFARDKEICLKLLMATYARENTGSILVSLISSSFSQSVNIDISEIKDTKFHTIMCVEKKIYTSLLSEGIEINIQGIDTSNGNAITFWLTKDTEFGKVLINNIEMEGSLIYHFVTQDYPSVNQKLSLVLLVVISILNANLLLLFMNDKNQKNKNEINHSDTMF